MDKNAEYCIYIALHKIKLENKLHFPAKAIT